ncbi:MAG: trypsin-like peptidase domain-containing protein [Reichenbachiella sp.]|uniref:S1C family serine protease n=1 Tax=Reichenbachiella sp. TaxID=2184521 RepID=UPI0032981853
MKKSTLFLAVFLLINFKSNAQSLSDLYATLSKSVVKIIIEGKDFSVKEGQMVTNQGIGSGVLIDADGLVLTASHVVQTAENIKVQFSDGETIPAKVVSSAPFADVAAIKLSWAPKDKVVAKLGDSDKVRVGDEIFMVGSPYGLDFSLSVGYISGRHTKRRFANGAHVIEFFQTDASINHGNSGGPMFNMKGEVVGLASYILSESGGFQGLGFAATSNVCKELLLDEVTPWTGMEAVLVGGELGSALNIPQNIGLLVQKVTLFSPIGALGIEGGTIPMEYNGETILIGGDIILAVDGTPITTEAGIEKIAGEFAKLEKGDSFTLIVWRDGKKHKLKGTVGGI